VAVPSRRVPGGLALLRIALLASATLVAFALFRALRHDDAYIAFQYARNWAEGRGLVFNPGERVFGFTSPLQVMVLAAASRVLGDLLPSAAIAIGAAALTAQAALLWALARDTAPRLGIAVALLAWLGLFGAHEWLALETNLFVALVLATLYFLRSGSEGWTGVFLGLAFLCRYDAALLIPIVVASHGIRRRALPIRTLAVSLLVVLPWLIGASLYFGSPVPTTFFAKRRFTPFWPYLAHYRDVFSAQLATALGAPRLAPVSLGLWLLGAASLLRRPNPFLEFQLFALLLALAYARIGPPVVHHWHLYPAALALGGLLVAGCLWIADGIAAAIRAGERSLRNAIAGALVAGLAVSAGVQAVRLARFVPEHAWLGGRDRMYASIAGWVRTNVGPEASFQAVEVGTLGYLTRLRMIDAAGLISPTNDFPRTNAIADYVDLVRRHRPDVVLASTPSDANQIARATGYRVAVRLPVQGPWSVLLIRGPDVLRDDRPGSTSGPVPPR
jgi:hypothetical protein